MAVITKAVILARGLGTRMRRADASSALSPDQAAIADSGVKAMIPIATPASQNRTYWGPRIGRPFLDYVLSALADAGYREVSLVIGPEHNLIREYYAGQQMRRIALSYAIQPEPRGTADAVLAAEGFVGDAEFIVMNSDDYYPIPVLQTLRGMAGPGAVLFRADSLVQNSNIPAERVRTFAYCEVREGYLAGMKEKPDPSEQFPPDALVSLNLWRVPPAFFEHCRTVPLSPRGEYELPLAINQAVRSGMRLQIETSNLGVLDLSQRSDIAAVAATLKNIEVAL